MYTLCRIDHDIHTHSLHPLQAKISKVETSAHKVV